MRLLIKSDDYGFSRGVTDGTIDAIKDGIITCAGLFVTTPDYVLDYAVERMKECPDCDFGIDINIVGGRPAADPKLLPNLVDENGYFIRSTVKYADPRFKEDPNLWPYEEVCIETAAQIEKYIAKVGKKPPYINGHSISAASTVYCDAIRDTGAKYGVPYIAQVFREMDFKRVPNWYVKPFTEEAQMNTDAESFLLEHLEQLKDEDLVMAGGHAGYLDDELYQYTTFTIIRMKDHKAFTSPKIKEWIKANNVELVPFTKIYNK
jgi:Uncharacterized protein conserved in bacteria